MMKKTLVVLLLNSAYFALAQGPGNPPSPADMAARRVEGLTKLLTLTAAQQQQATTIFTNSATTEASVRDSLRTAHQGLSDAIKTNAVGTIDQLAANIGSLTAQETSIQAKADAAFYQILTPDQQTTLNSSRGAGGGFGRGAGGFGGTGGPGPRLRGGPRQ